MRSARNVAESRMLDKIQWGMHHNRCLPGRVQSRNQSHPMWMLPGLARKASYLGQLPVRLMPSELWRIIKYGAAAFHMDPSSIRTLNCGAERNVIAGSSAGESSVKHNYARPAIPHWLMPRVLELNASTLFFCRLKKVASTQQPLAMWKRTSCSSRWWSESSICLAQTLTSDRDSGMEICNCGLEHYQRVSHTLDLHRVWQESGDGL